MAQEGEVLFDGSEDIENWDSVDTVSDSNQDFNDYDLEFIDASDVDEGAYWVGEYTGTREIGDAQSASCIFDSHEDELSYAFPNHAMLKSQLSDTQLSENQNRADNPVEEGETVAIVYQGTQELDDRPMDMHIWEVRRPPQ
jgi:hypothetical protein